VRAHWRAELIVLGLVATSTLGAHVFLPRSVMPYTIGAIVASGGWWLYVVMLQTGGLINKQVGVMAEEWTAWDLQKLRKHGWYLVNHVMLEHVDIDHALIGPGGFFAIETKYRSDWQYARKDLAEIAGRAIDSARRLEPRMGLRPRSVRPMVVMWGPAIAEQFDTPFEEHGITFCPGHRLPSYFGELSSDVGAGEVATAYENLSAYVRKRDRGETALAGTQPRSIDRVVNDAVAVAFGTVAAALAVASPVSISPQGLWGVAAAVAICSGALAVRRRWPASTRTRVVTTAVLTTAAGVGVLLAAALTVQLLT
jgi:hypothetical protein